MLELRYDGTLHITFNKKRTCPIVTMPITIKCWSCGFVLYQGKDLKSVDDILKRWGYRCPCCLSTLKPKIHAYKTEIVYAELQEQVTESPELGETTVTTAENTDSSSTVCLHSTCTVR